MRKPKEDPIARTVAENQFTDHGPSIEGAREALSFFPAVEFETTTRTVQGEELHLRRVVITGKWEIDPNAALGGRSSGGKSVPPTS